MIRDIGILGCLSIIYFAMVATLIRVALFYRNEQRGDGSAEHLSHGDAHTIGPGRTAPNAMLSPPTKMTPGRIVRPPSQRADPTPLGQSGRVLSSCRLNTDGGKESLTCLTSACLSCQSFWRSSSCFSEPVA